MLQRGTYMYDMPELKYKEKVVRRPKIYYKAYMWLGVNESYYGMALTYSYFN